MAGPKWWGRLQEWIKRFLRLLDFIGRWETRLNALLWLAGAGFVVALIGVVLFVTLPVLALVVLGLGGYMMTSAWLHLRAIHNRPPVQHTGTGVDDAATGEVIKKDQVETEQARLTKMATDVLGENAPQLLSTNMTWDTPSGVFVPDEFVFTDSKGRTFITFKLRTPKGFSGEAHCLVAIPGQGAMYRAKAYASVSLFGPGEVSVSYPDRFPGAPSPRPGLFHVIWQPKPTFGTANPLEYWPELKW